jgi:hypothetical protein
MSATQNLIDAIGICVQAKQPLNVIGEPGTGKSSIMEGIARGLGWPLEVILLSIREPTDLGGFPVLTERGMELMAPSWARRFSKEQLGDKDAIIFIDELSTAAPATQAASLRVVNDRVVGDTILGPNVAMVAAMNPPECAANGFNLAAPLSNRFCQIQAVNGDHEAYVEGLLGGFPDPKVPHLPANWRDLIPQKAATVGAFITARPTLLQATPKTEAEGSKPFPTKRSWHRTTNLLAAMSAVGASPAVKSMLISGMVGEGPAQEFIAYERDLDLPNPEELLKDFKLVKIKNLRGDRQFAVLASITAAIMANNTPKRWTTAFDLFAYAYEQAPDIASSSVRTLLKVRPAKAEYPDSIMVFADMLRAAGISVGV